MTWRVRAATALAAISASVWAVMPVAAQTPPDADTDAVATNVSVQPRGTDADDPHNGTWFVVTAFPGDPERTVANIINPGGQPASVELYVRDLEVVGGATAIEEDPNQQAGVGSWVEIERQSGLRWDPETRSAELAVGPGRTRPVTLTVTVPSGTPAGDYVGVVIAQTLTRGADVDIRQRHATRIYVTVPGIADTSFEIVDVETTLDSAWWPREATVVVTLDNDGAIRIEPDVTVDGIRALGPSLLLTRTQETYVARVGVSPFDGRMDFAVDARDEASQEFRTIPLRGSLIPWRLLTLVAAAALGAALLARRSRRRSRLRQLETDFQRLERLVTTVRQEAGLEGGVGSAAALVYDDDDPEHALHVALKRARRTQSYDSLARVALALHARSIGDPLPVLVEALQHETEHTAELLAAASTYEAPRLALLTASAHLPPEVLEQLRSGERAELPALGSGATVVLPAHRAAAAAARTQAPRGTIDARSARPAAASAPKGPSATAATAAKEDQSAPAKKRMAAAKTAAKAASPPTAKKATAAKRSTPKQATSGRAPAKQATSPRAKRVTAKTAATKQANAKKPAAKQTAAKKARVTAAVPVRTSAKSVPSPNGRRGSAAAPPAAAAPAAKKRETPTAAAARGGSRKKQT